VIQGLPLKLLESTPTLAEPSSVGYDSATDYDAAQHWGGPVTTRVPASGSISSLMPSGSRHLVLVTTAHTTDGGVVGDMLMRFNDDDGANYNTQYLDADSGSDTAARDTAGTSIAIGVVPGTGAGRDDPTTTAILIPFAFSTDKHKAAISLSGAFEESVRTVTGRWANNAAITHLEFPVAGIFHDDSRFDLYVVDEDYAVAGAEDIKTADGTFAFNGSPQDRGDLYFVGALRSDQAADADLVIQQFNGDTTASNYARQRLEGTDASTAASAASDNEIGEVAGNGATANAFGAFLSVIRQHAIADNDPHILSMSGFHEATGPDSSVRVYSARRNNVEPVKTVVFKPSAGTNFKSASSMSQYYVPKMQVGYKEIVTNTASVTFTLADLDIPSGVTDLWVSWYARTSTAAATEGVDVEFNGDTTASKYDRQIVTGDGSSVTSPAQNAAEQGVGTVPGASATANIFGGGSMMIADYASTDRQRHRLYLGGAADDVVSIESSRFESAAAVTSIKLTPSAGGNFVDGSIFTVEALLPVGGEDASYSPSIHLEVDWADDGFVDANVDLRSNLISVRTTSGKRLAVHPTGQASAGTLNASLYNPSGIYSSFNSGSDLSGLLHPGHAVRLVAHTPAYRHLWTGKLQSIEPMTLVSGAENTVQITAVGPLAPLAESQVRAAVSTDVTSGAALTTLLTAAGLSATDYDVDAGQETFVHFWAGRAQGSSQNPEEENTLKAARSIEWSEGGYLGESKDGRVVLEDRHHRMLLDHQHIQATHGDDLADEFQYTEIKQVDTTTLIFNEFRNTLHTFKNGGVGTVLWTNPFANATGDAPLIDAGATVVYWVEYPTPSALDDDPDAVGVVTWVSPADTTDFQLFANANGTGTDLTANLNWTVTASGNTLKLSGVNTGAAGYLTKHQQRGTPLLENDPITVFAQDSTSITRYGTRIFPRPVEARWVSNLGRAQDWCDFNAVIFGEPLKATQIVHRASRNLAHLHEMNNRWISDRITINADSTAALGISDGFFVENVGRYLDAVGGYSMTMVCSEAAQFSDFWVLDVSTLDTQTRLAY